MNAETIFYILIAILIINYVLDSILGALNASKFEDAIPNDLKDVYEEDRYTISQSYKKEKYRFGILSSTLSLLITLAFFFFDGFSLVDELARSFSENTTIITLLFFGIILFGSAIVSLPFSYYSTFVIEEKYGFNTTNIQTFILDKVKGGLMGIAIGGGILAAILWFYKTMGSHFWLYAWGLVTIFSVFMNMFYARLIVPLFNKQTALAHGSLRSKIETYASTVGFSLKNIFVIDGSKRSTKANAYFSGFGSEKRITLYDTLIKDLDEEEIVAVLAHEVGHYKRNHILYNLVASILSTGFTLWLLSIFVDSEPLSVALGVKEVSFHVGLIAFGILYSPISEITGLLMNLLSRKFEYQADDYAKKTYDGAPLISALKKLSKNSLSNLTPHPAYVFMHYSHPTLLDRFRNLNRN